MVKLQLKEYEDEKIFRKIAMEKTKINKVCNDCQKRDYRCNTCLNGNRGKMIKMEPYIKKRYDFYRKNSKTLDLIKPEWEPEIGNEKLLRMAYKSKLFEKVKKDIIENLSKTLGRNICPFCMISEPNGFDHYFPEKSYPEFSIFTPNLVPCCSKCNEYKSGVLSKNGVRNVIHYYYDDIPEEQFLKASISLDKGIPVISFKLEFNKNLEIHKIIKNQFEELHLFERYKSNCNYHISTLCENFVSCGTPIEECIVIINSKIKVLRKHNGNNYWLVSLYQALIENRSILEEMMRSVR